MKRINNLYEEIYKLENINYAYDMICSHIKNKRKIEYLKENRCIIISKIHNILKNREYEVGAYNVFTIYEPKKRRIVSLNLQDKIINHLISRYIILPAILPCLIDANVASRKNGGTKKGLDLANKFHIACKAKYKNYYILKCDISKFFQSINHEILMEKLKKRIKDKDALNILSKLINSDANGINIGTMSSQTLAICKC